MELMFLLNSFEVHWFLPIITCLHKRWPSQLSIFLRPCLSTIIFMSWVVLHAVCVNKMQRTSYIYLIYKCRIMLRSLCLIIFLNFYAYEYILYYKTLKIFMVITFACVILHMFTCWHFLCGITTIAHVFNHFSVSPQWFVFS